jgi:hypothetical protein
VVSAFIALVLAVVTLANLPDSTVQRSLLTVGQPYLNLLGLDQNWGVFAPQGRQFVMALEAEIRYRDGSTSIWRTPEGDPVFGAYWDYRWLKWAEYVATARELDDTAIWRPAALWVARNASRRGKRPTEVALVAREYDLAPPGKSPDRGPWRRTVLYRVPFQGK